MSIVTTDFTDQRDRFGGGLNGITREDMLAVSIRRKKYVDYKDSRLISADLFEHRLRNTVCERLRNRFLGRKFPIKHFRSCSFTRNSKQKSTAEQKILQCKYNRGEVDNRREISPSLP